VLNCCVQISPYHLYPWTGRPEIAAWREFASRARAWFVDERLLGGPNRMPGSDLAHAAWQGFVNTPKLLRLAAFRLLDELKSRAPTAAIAMVNFVEMEPRPENRITLTGDRDALGMPIPRLVHELSRRDVESLHRLHEQIAMDLETMGCG